MHADRVWLDRDRRGPVRARCYHPCEWKCEQTKKESIKGIQGEYGHTPLSRAELDFLSEEKPRKVFIGTGQYGDLPVTADATALLSRYDTMTAPTPGLLSLIGQEKNRFVAILHVTC